MTAMIVTDSRTPARTRSKVPPFFAGDFAVGPFLASADLGSTGLGSTGLANLNLANPYQPRARGTAGRRAAETRGRTAEDVVARQLEAQGFDVLARRLRTGAGEIDLVVADAGQLVFVEVKARRSLADAAYAVSPRQQARLLEAAAAALAAHEEWARPETRLDVALVAGSTVEMLRDAVRYC